MQAGENIAVWFSCGAASAVAAKKTIELYSDANIRVINNPIAEEDADNVRFMRDISEWLGVDIETASNDAWPDNSAETVWKKRRYMSGIAGAPCTLELKKRARQKWENSNPCEWLVLGFTADEQGRADRFRRNERSTLLTPLIDLRLTKKDCFRILSAADIELPAVYHRGYPNANCIGCVKATSATYWNHVRNDSPEVFERRAKQSRELGARLVRHNGERVFLDELPPDAKGAAMDNGNFECGLFCETD